MAGSGGDRTEKPTAQRLKKAREQGQFLSAKGFVAGIQFLATIIILQKLVRSWGENIRSSMTTLLQQSMSGDIGPAEWLVLLRTSFSKPLLPVVYAVAALLLVTVATHFLVTKMGFSVGRLAPKFSNLNPLARLRDIPQRGIPSAIEALLLLTALGLSVQAFFANYRDGFLRLPFESVSVGAAQIFSSIEDMLWKAAAVFVLLGAIDLFRQHRKLMKSLRMTKQEIKEEHKHNDGDPQVKSRIRRLRRDLLRRQMMRDVPKATAVIVNPTHFAVAIRYEMHDMPCPMTVAKGKNWLALRIREIAREHDVPIVENPPLARALYEICEVGQNIPPDFYKAVAEVLAYIYRLMGRKLQ